MKFTKEDIHAKFFSDDIDAAMSRRLDKIGLDVVAVVLANRLGEVLVSLDKPDVVDHCIELIQRKVKC